MVGCNHMLHLIPAVYSSIFEIVSFPAFMFLIGVFICELIILKKWINKKIHYYILFAMIFVFSVIMLFHGHESLYEKLMPASNTTLLGRSVASPELSQGIFLQFSGG